MKATYIISTYHKPGLLFRVHGSLAQKVHMSTFPVGLGKGLIGTIFSLSTITWISAKLGTIILLFFSSQSFLDRNIFIQATAPENTTALQLHIFDQYVSLSRKFYHAPVFYHQISWTKQIYKSKCHTPVHGRSSRFKWSMYYQINGVRTVYPAFGLDLKSVFFFP